MRGHCQRSRMDDFSAHFNEGNVKNQEKMELVKMFVEFLDSDKCGKMHKHGHEHHGKFGRFGKHRHGSHHREHSSFRCHGHHGHGPHHRGKRSPHFHGKFGHRHHRHQLHHNNGKFKAHWIIDLTENDEDAQCVRDNECNTLPANQPTTSSSNEQEQAAMANKTQCPRFKRHRCGRKRILVLSSTGKNTSTLTDNACQTDMPITEDMEQTQENVTTMIQNIDIDNSE